MLELDTVDGYARLKHDNALRDYFFDRAYAHTDEITPVALAVLQVGLDSSYTEPHARPNSSGSRGINTNYKELESRDNEAELFSIYPNPTNSNFTLLVNVKKNADIAYIVYDVLGKEIFKGTLVSGLPHELNTNQLVNGLYTINFTQQGQFLNTQKLILMKQ